MQYISFLSKKMMQYISCTSEEQIFSQNLKNGSKGGENLFLLLRHNVCIHTHGINRYRSPSQISPLLYRRSISPYRGPHRNSNTERYISSLKLFGIKRDTEFYGGIHKRCTIKWYMILHKEIH